MDLMGGWVDLAQLTLDETKWHTRSQEAVTLQYDYA